MTEINIDKFKAELEKAEEGFYFKEIKRIAGKNGQRKDVMGKTQNRFKFDIVSGINGKFLLVGADEKIDLPVNSKIFMTESNCFIIKKEDGMIFLNTNG